MTPQRRRMPASALNDRQLVMAYQNGTLDAYDEMYRRYHARVMHVCSRMLTSRLDAEEAAQETFLKAYQALPRFNGSYQLGAWLARIATNVCLDRIRLRSRSAVLVGLPSDHDMTDVERGPEELVAGGDHRLEEAIGGIYPLHAQALKLRAEGLSHEEIGERLDMTAAQVKALLHRARTSFRRAWDKAQGWALAPLFALRNLIDERYRAASAAGSNVVASSSALSPLMSERSAVAAAIVAAALTGLPSAPAPSTVTDGPPAVVRSADDDQRRAAFARTRHRAHSATAARGTAASGEQPPGEEANPLAAVQEELDKKQGDITKRTDPRKQPPPDDDGPLENPFGGKSVPKNARQLLDKVLSPTG